MVIEQADFKQWAELWDKNMPTMDNSINYKNANKFFIKEKGEVIASFALYYDSIADTGISGNFISGWAKRHNLKAVYAGIAYAIFYCKTPIYISTKFRQVKILANKIGKFLKKDGDFCYYIIEV